MKRNQGYGRRTSRGVRKDSSLFIALVLILASLVIVTASKAISRDQYETASSYGSQLAASRGQERPKAVQQSDFPAGTKIDEYEGIAVYSNGSNYMSSHGLSYSADGYYYGYEWQCVEFVKRFYYVKYGHEMPDGAGNAKYFFNPMLEQGAYNEQRGLKQYNNGGDVKPRANDLLVFTDGAYGHVAIISKVGADWLEVVQQNSEVTRERYELQVTDGKYMITGEKEPAGWLRI